MKNFPFELYMKALGIIQRLMCYQKKYRARLDYNWQNLWTCLIYTLKFSIGCDSYLMSKGHNMFQFYSKVIFLNTNISEIVCQKCKFSILFFFQIIVIFNIFITYGDTFLPNPESYDYLYYDLMRMRQVFDNFLLLCMKFAFLSNNI